METIFILDDEEDLLQSLQFYLQKEGYEVKTFTKSKEMMAEPYAASLKTSMQ